MTILTVSVAEVALKFRCSLRRVRQLILTRRLTAFKDEKGHWRVVYPFDVRLGKRGPMLGSFKRAASTIVKQGPPIIWGTPNGPVRTKRAE